MGIDKIFLGLNAIPSKSKITGAKKLEGWLVVISSILLGIWSLRGTIALRNTLIVFGMLMGIIFIMRSGRHLRLLFASRPFISSPIFLFSTIFLWVLIHYFVVSGESPMQLIELKSTWLRSILVAIFGFATGLALVKNNRLISLLWVGIYISFIVLFFQYIPKAISINSLYAIDYFNYIYLLKINGVLAGSFFISAAIGYFIDLNRKTFSYSNITNYYYLSGSFFILYSFVYIFDARSGIAISIAMAILWLIMSVGNYLYRVGSSRHFLPAKRASMIGLFAIILILFFSYKQFVHNPTWGTIAQDAAIGMQIDRYPNWANPNLYGPPIDDSGRLVVSSIYERTALIFVGLRLIANNPLGTGVLKNAFPSELERQRPGTNYATAPSTHSGWIEFGLAFGWLGLILIAALPVTNIIISRKTQGLFYGLSIFLSFNLILIYGFGELSTGHALEIYFYINALIFGINAGENIVKINK